MSLRREPTFQETASMAKLIGARQVYGWVSGRSSATDIAILREIREKKMYVPLAETWAEFCEYQLQVSKRTIDRNIALLNELGPAYFTLSRLAAISVPEFRAISGAIKNNSIEHHGEPIPLVEENATRLQRVVRELLDLATADHPDRDLRRSTAAAKEQRGGCPWLLERLEYAFRRVLADLQRFFEEAEKQGVVTEGIIPNLLERLSSFQLDYENQRRRRREQSVT